MNENPIGDLALVVKRTQERRQGQIVAFTAVTSRDRDYPFEIGVAILGEAGYALTPVPVLYTSYGSASDAAGTMNKLAGLTDATAIAIIADTMHRSSRALEEREGIVTLRMSKEEAKDVLALIAGEDDDDLMCDIAHRLACLIED